MQDTDVLDRHWCDEGLGRPLRRSLTFSQAGLMLGRGTLLAEFEKERRAARTLALDGNEARLLSLLTAAHGKPVAEGVIEKIRRAGKLWCAGEKALAQIHLAFIGLPTIDEMGAYRLFLAGVALEKGLGPSDLMKALGFPRAARDVEKYSPDQPRVPAGSGRESGQWTKDDSLASISADEDQRVQLAGDVIHVGFLVDTYVSRGPGGIPAVAWSTRVRGTATAAERSAVADPGDRAHAAVTIRAIAARAGTAGPMRCLLDGAMNGTFIAQCARKVPFMARALRRRREVGVDPGPVA